MDLRKSQGITKVNRLYFLKCLQQLEVYPVEIIKCFIIVVFMAV